MCFCCGSSYQKFPNVRVIEELTTIDACHRIKTAGTSIHNNIWEATFSIRVDDSSTRNYNVTFQQFTSRDDVLFLGIQKSRFAQPSNAGFRVIQGLADTCFAYGKVRLDTDVYFSRRHDITHTFYDPSTTAVTFMLRPDSTTKVSNYTIQSLVLKPAEPTKKKH